MKTKYLIPFIFTGHFLTVNITAYAEAVSDSYVPDFLYEGFRKISKVKSTEHTFLGPDSSQINTSESTRYEWVEGTVLESGIEQVIYNKSEKNFSDPYSTHYYSLSNSELRLYKKDNCRYIPFQTVYKYGMEVGEEFTSSYNVFCLDLDKGYINVIKKIKIISYENISTPFGNHDNCLKVEATYDNTFFSTIDGSSTFLFQETYTHWFQKNKEEIKVVITSTGNGGSITKYLNNIINPHLTTSTIINNLLLK